MQRGYLPRGFRLRDLPIKSNLFTKEEVVILTAAEFEKMQAVVKAAREHVADHSGPDDLRIAIDALDALGGE